jgi:hypothetical protein
LSKRFPRGAGTNILWIFSYLSDAVRELLQSLEVAIEANPHGGWARYL